MNPFLPDIGAVGQREIVDNVKRGRYEMTSHGMYIPSMRIHFGLKHFIRIDGEIVAEAHNLTPTEGKNHYQDTVLLGVQTWYIAPYANATDPLLTWNASNFASNANEVTNYSQATRPAWVPATPANNGTVTTQTRSTITASTGGIPSINGTGLLSSSVKAGTSGVLVSAVRYPSSVSVAEAQDFDLGYTSTLLDDSEVS